MRYPFESDEAQLLNLQIFETIYYAALEASCELAAEHGPYETYAGCPVSKGVSVERSSTGSQVLPNHHLLYLCRLLALKEPVLVSQILQYDMWDKTPTDLWDWKALKEKIAK